MLITGIIKRQGDTKRTIMISLLASFSPVLLLFILIKVNDWLVIWLTKSQMAMPIAIGALFLAFSLLLAQYIIRVYDIYSLYKTKPTKEIDD
jgi:presenilin-like A22 family membrane protease